MILIRLLYTLLCMLLLGACKEDFSYPNVFTELAEVKTDAVGQLRQLTTDQGNTFAIQAFTDTAKFTPDSVYRMLVVFEPVNEQKNELFVYSARPVLSELPKPINLFENGIKTDPVDVQSIWKTSKYLNMILHVQTKDKPHKFHFVEQGIYPYNDKADAPIQGKQVLELTLYHDRGNDMEAFTTKYCFSIPLYPYADRLRQGDIVRFHLHTYKEGILVREYEF